jgi:hypothetical protein
MHTGALRKWALALTFWLALHLSSLRATPLPLGPYGTSPITFDVDTNGLLSDTGTYGTGTLSLSGGGTWMFWYPGKAAFRAGLVSGTQWNDANIGDFSLAFGVNTTASGYASFASGAGSTASGKTSIAMGQSASASGNYSMAIGSGNTASALCSAVIGGCSSIATGNYSVTMGCLATASGSTSTAMGCLTTASGLASTAMGYDLVASGSYSTAMGAQTTASGSFSTAMSLRSTASGYCSSASGEYTNASGNYSSAFGEHTTATADLSFVLGTYNVGGGNSTSWVATDPLFEIGDGTSSSATSDALVVYKNGIVAVHTELRTAPGGDISMGSFTAGTSP